MKRGDQVADFQLPDQTGTVRSLTRLLADGPIVPFLHPAEMTPGCTMEACHFRDLAPEFAAAGANRVGISTDAVAKQLDVERGLLGKLVPVERTTFVIDTDRTVLEVIASEMNMNTHADKALQVLRQRESA